MDRKMEWSLSRIASRIAVVTLAGAVAVVGFASAFAPFAAPPQPTGTTEKASPADDVAQAKKPIDVPVGNGYAVRLEERQSIRTQIGITFALRVFDQAKPILSGGLRDAWVIRWESLTPEIIETVSIEKGVFRAKAVGHGVVRAEVYDGHLVGNDPGDEQPRTRSAIVLVQVDPIHRIRELHVSSILTKNQPSEVEYRAYRWSTDQNEDQKKDKDKAVEALPERERTPPEVGSTTPSTGNPTESGAIRQTGPETVPVAAPGNPPHQGTTAPPIDKPHLSTPQTEGMLSALPVYIESLNPDRLLVGISAKTLGTCATLQPGAKAILKGIQSGPARVRATCGGIEAEFEYTVATPGVKVEIQNVKPGKALVVGSPYEVKLVAFDQETGKALPPPEDPHETHKISLDTSPADGVTVGPSRSQTGTAATFSVRFDDKTAGKCLLKGQVDGLSISSGSLEVLVRKKASELRTPSPSYAVITQDTISVPVTAYDSKSAAIPGLDAEDVAVKVTGTGSAKPSGTASVVKTDAGLALRISVDGLERFTVALTLDGTPWEVLVQPESQLEVASSRVSERTARDLFGAQVAKEFIIRQLVFTNRLSDVQTNSDIKNMPVLVYGDTLMAHVLIARDVRSVTAEQVNTALQDASYLFDRGRLTPQQTEDQREAHTRTIYNLLFYGGANSTPGANTKVAVIPYSPILMETFNTMYDAIKARRSEDVLEKAFGLVSMVTTAAASLPAPGEPTLIFGNFLKHWHNPFFSDTAKSTKIVMDGLIRGFIDVQKADRDRSGKALLASPILGTTLTVSPNQPQRRYLFIPRDSVEPARGRQRPWIVDIVDDQFRVSYTILTGLKQQT